MPYSQAHIFLSSAGSLILSTTYGIDVAPKNDPLIAIAEKGMHAMSMTANAGAYLGELVLRFENKGTSLNILPSRLSTRS